MSAGITRTRLPRIDGDDQYTFCRLFADLDDILHIRMCRCLLGTETVSKPSTALFLANLSGRNTMIYDEEADRKIDDD